MPTVYSVKMGLRRRALTILFLPITIVIFVVGWVFYCIGKKQDRGSTKTPYRKTTVTEESTTDEYVEVGLIDDLVEKQPKAE